MASTLFYLFAGFTVLCAAGVVFNRNAVNAAMCLLLSLVGVAGLFVQLDAYLLAFLLLLVYAGAVVALFLFIIMLLDVKGRQKWAFNKVSTVAGLLAFALLLSGVSTFAARGQLDTPNPNAMAAVGTSLKQYAYQLFTTYLLPVQVMGFLLLIAMLGVIVLSKRWEGLDDIK
jgi:NADH-quinone oxidoreductase subunit J